MGSQEAGARVGLDEAVLIGGIFRQRKLCKCATWAKVRNKDEKCPLGKW